MKKQKPDIERKTKKGDELIVYQCKVYRGIGEDMEMTIVDHVVQDGFIELGQGQSTPMPIRWFMTKDGDRWEIGLDATTMMHFGPERLLSIKKRMAEEKERHAAIMAEKKRRNEEMPDGPPIPGQEDG